jgi:hypothetical protein
MDLLRETAAADVEAVQLVGGVGRGGESRERQSESQGDGWGA